MYKYLISAIALAFSAGMAFAEPTISVDSVKQRYPWNGLTDVGYTIAGANDGHWYEVVTSVRSAGEVRSVSLRSAPHFAPGHDWPLSNGTFRASFDLSSTFAESFGKGAKFEMSVVDKGEIPWPADATGAPTGIMGDLMTIDISGGSDAEEYPVAYFPNVDTGRFNCDMYKKDKIVLRYIPAGSYMIGYGTSNSANLPRQQVTIKHAMYVALFKNTEYQWTKIMGTSEWGRGDLYPSSGKTWAQIRGTAANTGTPPSGGIFYKLSQKVKYGGSAITGWDLPTEAQWEIAARAGSPYQWPCENESELGDYAWIKSNSGGVPHPVGLKKPNAYGLYDALGNIWDWCLDADTAVYDNSYVETPNTSLSTRIHRGGRFGFGSDYCSFSWRGGNVTNEASGLCGFRLFLICP